MVSDDDNFHRYDYPVGCVSSTESCLFADPPPGDDADYYLGAILQLQTLVNDRLLIPRLKVIRKRFMRVVLQPHDSLTSSYYEIPDAEEVAYMAFETNISIACVEGMSFETWAYRDVTNVKLDVEFDYFYATPPGLFGLIGTSTSLTDSTGLRAFGRTQGSASIITQEDQCVDEETEHTTGETVYAFISGLQNLELACTKCAVKFKPEPTYAPSALPTTTPTVTPTVVPSSAPTFSPTHAPTMPGDTVIPTATPTATPTASPTHTPTLSPTTCEGLNANRTSDAIDMIAGEVREDVWLEGGFTDAGDQEWVSISSSHDSFENAVVFISLPDIAGETSDDGYPAIPRVRNVVNNAGAVSFDVKLYQANDSFCLKTWIVPVAISPPVRVSWMVVEKGAWNVSGAFFMVDSGNITRKNSVVSDDDNFHRYDYPVGCVSSTESCLFADPPPGDDADYYLGAILQLQTLVNDRLLIPRLKVIRKRFMRVVLQPHDSLTSSYYEIPDAEEVAYMAFETNISIACVEGMSFETWAYRDVTNVKLDVEFDYFYATPPGLFGLIGTSTSLTDSTGLRAFGRTQGSASIITQEDQCVDEETEHTTGETVYAFISGLQNLELACTKCAVKFKPEPTYAPSALPTTTPTVTPTVVPSSAPTFSPTEAPTLPGDTVIPTTTPTATPTASPTHAPTASPTTCDELNANRTSDAIDMIAGEVREDVWLEGGFTDAGDQEWVSISSSHDSFENAVVFISLPDIAGETSDDGYPAIPRVRNVVNNAGAVSFDVKLYQANDSFCLKTWIVPVAISPPVRVSWMVVEKGAWNVSGAFFMVDSGDITRKNSVVSDDDNFHRYDYPVGCVSSTESCLFADPPPGDDADYYLGAILQLQTLVNDRLLIPRLKVIRKRFMRVVLQPHDSLTSSYYEIPDAEEVAYMAFETNISIACVEGMSFETWAYRDVTNVKLDVEFHYFYATPPGLFGLIGTSTSLTDSTGLRAFGRTQGSASIITQEDQCVDEETEHTTGETVYAFISGLQNLELACTKCAVKFKPEPTYAPSALPTTTPTVTPTVVPSSAPTFSPTHAPTMPGDTVIPTATPTATPTASPTHTPTLSPTTCEGLNANRTSDAIDMIAGEVREDVWLEGGFTDAGDQEWVSISSSHDSFENAVVFISLPDIAGETSDDGYPAIPRVRNVVNNAGAVSFDVKLYQANDSFCLKTWIVPVAISPPVRVSWMVVEKGAWNVSGAFFMVDSGDITRKNSVVSDDDNFHRYDYPVGCVSSTESCLFADPPPGDDADYYLGAILQLQTLVNDRLLIPRLKVIRKRFMRVVLQPHDSLTSSYYEIPDAEEVAYMAFETNISIACVEGMSFETWAYRDVTNVKLDVEFDYFYATPPGLFGLIGTSTSLTDSTGLRAFGRTQGSASIITQEDQCVDEETEHTTGETVYAFISGLQNLELACTKCAVKFKPEPTYAPSALPTTTPTVTPTVVPSSAPTFSPTHAPTMPGDTVIPTATPTATPTASPTHTPTLSPTTCEGLNANRTSDAIDMIAGEVREDVWLEGGFTDAGDQEWVSISSSHDSFENAVVFISLPDIAGETSDDGYPAIPRVRNVVNNAGAVSFDVKLYQANDSFCLKTWIVPVAISPPVRVSWMVVEKGAWNVSGAFFMVDSGDITRKNSVVSDDDNFHRYDYPVGCVSSTESCLFADPPPGDDADYYLGAILQLQTLVNDRLLIPRLKVIRKRFMRVVLQPHDSLTSSYYEIPDAEEVAYMAFETNISIACVEGMSFETWAYRDVTNVKLDVEFDYFYATPPGLFGLIGTSTSLTDSTGLRAFGRTQGSASIITQEDQCVDEETEHTTGETVYAFISGLQNLELACTKCAVKFKPEPTYAPSALPTTTPTVTPTVVPSSAPTFSPTHAPTMPGDTVIPTATPTATPTASPTHTPTLSPTTCEGLNANRTSDAIDMIAGEVREDVWLEGGFTDAGDQEWVSISSSHDSFENAVVFISLPDIAGETSDDGYPAIPRVRNVMNNAGAVSFDVKLYQANDSFCLKTWIVPVAISPPVRVSWMVVEKGAWNVSGAFFMVDSGNITRKNSVVSDDDNFHRYDYPVGCVSSTESCLFADPPPGDDADYYLGAILQLQTLVNDRLLIPRLKVIRKRFMRVVLQPHDSLTSSYYEIPDAEEVAYMAFETNISIACVEGMSFETWAYRDVTNVKLDVEFDYFYATPPGLFGLIGTSTSLTDSTGLRAFGRTQGSASIITQEDQCVDEETEHTTGETVYAFISGLQNLELACTKCAVKFKPEPTYAPSALPTTTPTVTPTVSPSFPGDTIGPTSVPTVTPTVFPSQPGDTNKPTVVPTSSPTVSPSNPGDTNRPTDIPTSSPTVAPSQPGDTNAPTVIPTAVPTVFPSHPGETNSPTPLPTVGPTAVPSIELFTFPIDGDFSFHYNYTVTLNSSDYSSLTMISEDDSMWISFVDTMLTAELERSYSLEVWSVKTLMNGEEVHVHAVCLDEVNATVIVAAMTEMSDAFVECGKHSWAIVQGNLCIGCTEERVTYMQSGESSCAVLSGSVRDFVNPLPIPAAGEGTNCLLNSSVKMIETFIGFNVYPVDQGTIPEIVSFVVDSGSITQSSFGITVSVGPSPHGGGVFIRATNGNGEVKEVYAAVGAASSTIFIMIDGLPALTEFTVSGQAVDTFGNAGSKTSDIIVTTSCCHHAVLLEPLPSIVFSNLSDYDTIPFQERSKYVVRFEISQKPAVALRVSLSAAFPGMVTVPDHVDFTVNSSVLWGSFLITGAQGSGSVFLTLSGDSMADFSVINLTDSTISIVSITHPLPAPDISKATAVMNSEGTIVNLKFASGTDMFSSWVVDSLNITLGPIFPCDEFFDFPGVSVAGCSWADSATMVIYTSYYNHDGSSLSDSTGVLLVNDTITLLGGVLRAECFASTEVCLQNNAASGGSVVVSLESSSYPNVVLAAVNVFYYCNASDELLIDASQSSGHLGQPWKSVTWVVVASDGSNTTLIEEALMQYGVNIQLPVAISASLLTFDVSYTFSLALLNYAQPSNSELRFRSIEIAAKRAEVAPEVVAKSMMDLQQTVRRNRFLPLFLVASYELIAPCDLVLAMESSEDIFNITSVEMKWIVYQDFVATDLAESSVSVDPFALKIDSRLFDPNSHYQVVFLIEVQLYNLPLLSASLTFNVDVVNDAVVAQISDGFTSYSVNPQFSVTLDGTRSLDPSARDDELVTSNSIAQYEWDCTFLSIANYGENCMEFLKLPPSGGVVVISNSAMRNGDIYHVVLTFSVLDSDHSVRQDEASVDLFSSADSYHPDNTPISFIGGTNFFKGYAVHNRKVKVIANMDVVTAHGVNATWSLYGHGVELQLLTGFNSLAPPSQMFSYDQVSTGNGISFPVGVSRYSLLPGQAYNFDLSISGHDSANYSFAALTVIMNNAPGGGTLKVFPNNGMSFETQFELSAPFWSDEDFPLFYQFKFQIAEIYDSLAPTQFIGSNSVVSYESTEFPPGLTQPDSRNTSVLAIVSVADGLGSEAISSSAVTVFDVSTDLLNSEMVFNNLKNESQDVVHTTQIMKVTDAMKILQSAAMYLTAVDTANCSLAPSCEELNRNNCSETSHTCGPCLEGYDGVAGDFNSECSLYGDVEIVTEGENCIRHSDCQYKSCIGGVCVTPPPVCPLGVVTGSECSGHGTCSLLNFQGSVLDELECTVQNTNCLPTCSCQFGYAGADCSITTDDMEVRNVIRGELCEALSQVIMFTNPSLAALESLTSILRSVFDEFEISSAESMGHCGEALYHLSDMLPSFYSDTGAAFGQEFSDIISNFTSSEMYSYASTNITDAANVLLDSIKNDIIGNQPADSVVSRNIRISCEERTLRNFIGYELESPHTIYEEQYMHLHAYITMPDTAEGMDCEYFEDYGKYCIQQWGQVPFPEFRSNENYVSGGMQVLPFSTSSVSKEVPLPTELVQYKRFLTMHTKTNWSNTLVPVCYEMDLNTMNISRCKNCNIDSFEPFGVSVVCTDFEEALCPHSPLPTRRLGISEQQRDENAFDIAKSFTSSETNVVGAMFGGGDMHRSLQSVSNTIIFVASEAVSAPPPDVLSAGNFVVRSTPQTLWSVAFFLGFMLLGLLLLRKWDISDANKFMQESELPIRNTFDLTASFDRRGVPHTGLKLISAYGDNNKRSSLTGMTWGIDGKISTKNSDVFQYENPYANDTYVEGEIYDGDSDSYSSSNSFDSDSRSYGSSEYSGSDSGGESVHTRDSGSYSDSRGYSNYSRDSGRTLDSSYYSGDSYSRSRRSSKRSSYTTDSYSRSGRGSRDSTYSGDSYNRSSRNSRDSSYTRSSYSRSERGSRDSSYTGDSFSTSRSSQSRRSEGMSGSSYTGNSYSHDSGSTRSGTVSRSRDSSRDAYSRSSRDSRSSGASDSRTSSSMSQSRRSSLQSFKSSSVSLKSGSTRNRRSSRRKKNSAESSSESFSRGSSGSTVYSESASSSQYSNFENDRATVAHRTSDTSYSHGIGFPRPEFSDSSEADKISGVSSSVQRSSISSYMYFEVGGSGRTERVSKEDICKHAELKAEEEYIMHPSHFYDFPVESLLSRHSIWRRLICSIKRYHRVVRIFTYPSMNLTRLIRFLVFCSDLLIVMTATSLFCFIFFPDDNRCEEKATFEECAGESAERSLYQKSKPLCEWYPDRDPDTERLCSLRAIDWELTTLSIVAICLICITVFPRRFLQHVLEKICAKRPQFEDIGVDSTNLLTGSAEDLRMKKMAEEEDASVGYGGSRPAKLTKYYEGEGADVHKTSIYKDLGENEDVVMSPFNVMTRSYRLSYCDFISSQEELNVIIASAKELFNETLRNCKLPWRVNISNNIDVDYLDIRMLMKNYGQMMASMYHLGVHSDATPVRMQMVNAILYSTPHKHSVHIIERARKRAKFIQHRSLDHRVAQPGQTDYMDQTLLQFFILEQLNPITKFAIKKDMFELEHMTPGSVPFYQWFLSWVGLFGLWSVCGWWLLKCSTSNGSIPMVGFGWIFCLIVFMDFVVNDLCQIWVLHMAVTDAVRPQLRTIYRVLSEIYYKKVLRGHNPHKNVRIVQHLAPSCRSARLAPLAHLTAAGILSMLDDFDVYRCQESKHLVKIGLFSKAVLIIPSFISGRFPMIQQTMLDMMIPIAAFSFVLLHIFLQTVHVLLMTLLYFLIFCYMVYRVYKVVRKEKQMTSLERGRTADEDVKVMNVGKRASSLDESDDLSLWESTTRRIKSLFGMHVGPTQRKVEKEWKSHNSPFVPCIESEGKVISTDSLFSHVMDASELDWEEGLADVYAFICDIYNERFLQHSSSVLEDTVDEESSDFPSTHTDIVERTYAYNIKIPDEIAALEVTMDTWNYPAQLYWRRWWLNQLYRILSWFSGGSHDNSENIMGDGPSATFALNKFQTRNTKELDWDSGTVKTDENSDNYGKDQLVGVGHGLDNILEEDDEDREDSSVNDNSTTRSEKMRGVDRTSYPSIVTIDTFGSNQDDNTAVDALRVSKSSSGSTSTSASTSANKRGSSRESVDGNAAKVSVSSNNTRSNGGNTRSNPVEINYENVSKTFDAYAMKCKSDGLSDDGKPGVMQVPIHNLLNLANAVFSLPDHVLIEDTLVTEDEIDDTLTSLRDYVNYAQQQKRTDTAMMKFDPFIKWLENACGAILLKRRTLMSKKLGKKTTSQVILDKAEQGAGSKKGEEVLQMELAFNEEDDSVVSEMTRDSFLQEIDNSVKSGGTSIRNSLKIRPRTTSGSMKSGSVDFLPTTGSQYSEASLSIDNTGSRKSRLSSGRYSSDYTSKSGDSSSDPRKRKVTAPILKNYEENEGLAKDMTVSELKAENDSFTTLSESGGGTTVRDMSSGGGSSSVSHAGTSRSGDTSTIFGGQPGVIVSELCNALDYRPSQSSILEGDDSESGDDSRIRLPVVHEEGDDNDFRYSDVSYTGGMSTNTRHSFNDVVNTNKFDDSDTDDSCFRYSDVSFVGGQSTNTRHSKNSVLGAGTFNVDGEEFDVDVEMDETVDSNEESFEVEIQDPRPTFESSGGMSDLTFRQTTSSDYEDRPSSYDLQADVRLGQHGTEFEMSGDEASLGTMGNFTVNTRTTEGDDESKADNGVKIKETLFYM